MGTNLHRSRKRKADDRPGLQGQQYKPTAAVDAFVSAADTISDDLVEMAVGQPEDKSWGAYGGVEGVRSCQCRRSRY
jgi:hypothetical protein